MSKTSLTWRTGPAVVALVVLGMVPGCRAHSGEKVTFQAVSISPDGMYKCEVRETATTAQSTTRIRVYARKMRGASTDEPWELLEEGVDHIDSACRSNFSIDWEYDEHHRTRKVIVFGDLGSPPFPGTVIGERPFNAPKKD